MVLQRHNIIKMIGNVHYEVTLLERNDGLFYVHKHTFESDIYSPYLVDIGTAMAIFDQYIADEELS